jgi:hypothetical protein
MTNAQALAMNKVFLADLSRFVAASKGAFDEVVRQVLFDFSRAIVMRTPVDTGRLRANWQFGAGHIPTGEIDDVDPASGLGGPTEDRLATGARSALAGTIHYIVNNLPYAATIEYGQYPNPPKGGGRKDKTGAHVTRSAGGYSTQAPQGMVRITVVEYKQFLEQGVQKVKAAGFSWRH